MSLILQELHSYMFKFISPTVAYIQGPLSACLDNTTFSESCLITSGLALELTLFAFQAKHGFAYFRSLQFTVFLCLVLIIRTFIPFNRPMNVIHTFMGCLVSTTHVLYCAKAIRTRTSPSAWWYIGLVFYIENLYYSRSRFLGSLCQD